MSEGDAMKELRSWQDGIKAFFELYTRDEPDAVVIFEELYNEYKDFCKRNYLPAVSKYWMGRYLSKKGYQAVLAKNSRGVYKRAYRGLKLCTTQS